MLHVNLPLGNSPSMDAVVKNFLHSAEGGRERGGAPRLGKERLGLVLGKRLQVLQVRKLMMRG